MRSSRYSSKKILKVLVVIAFIIVLATAGAAVAKPGSGKGGPKANTTAVAAPATYQQAIFVRAAFGGPVAGAKVTLSSKASKDSYSGVTDSAGYAYFTDVPAGEYYVDTVHRDFRYSCHSLSVLADGEFTVYLHRKS